MPMVKRRKRSKTISYNLLVFWRTYTRGTTNWFQVNLEIRHAKISCFRPPILSRVFRGIWTYNCVTPLPDNRREWLQTRAIIRGWFEWLIEVHQLDKALLLISASFHCRLFLGIDAKRHLSFLEKEDRPPPMFVLCNVGGNDWNIVLSVEFDGYVNKRHFDNSGFCTRWFWIMLADLCHGAFSMLPWRKCTKSLSEKATNTRLVCFRIHLGGVTMGKLVVVLSKRTRTQNVYFVDLSTSGVHAHKH